MMRVIIDTRRGEGLAVLAGEGWVTTINCIVDDIIISCEFVPTGFVMQFLYDANDGRFVMIRDL